MKKVMIFILMFVSYLVPGQQSSVITYNPSNEIFRNPERGFSKYTDTPLSVSFVNSVKAQNISVVQRIYTIPQYRDKELPQEFLSSVENDLLTARNGGIKLVMRFSYTDEQTGEDAALDTILIHINQLKPILQNNYDVIVYLEAGFIGAWGEWYYSTHNLNNTNDRRTVLFALLDALPKERCVVVRTPDYKRKIFQDNQPLSLSEAYNGTKKARTGAHNDCFLANATDYGTYLDNDIEGDKNYLNLDNRFVPQGGETCNPSSYSGCDNALVDLSRMHWSVLNRDYHPSVIQGWINNGCIDEITKRLGYRFELLQAVIIDSVKPGGTFNLNFEIENVGFASPFNPRGVEVILRNTLTKAKYKLVTDEDPRFWLAGDTVNVNVTGGIKNNMPEGEYEVFLFLPDTVGVLHDRADYAIRLANENVWEDSTGYNSLQHTIIIDKNAAGGNYAGNNYFELFYSGIQPPDTTTEITIDGEFDDWSDYYLLDVGTNQENAGDALNQNVDLEDIWVTDSGGELYISYRLAGEMLSQYFYHVFFDIDNDTATGFHSAGSFGGFDYMIENNSLWKYNGVNGQWGWSYAGDVTLAKGVNEPSRVELAVPFSQLNITESGTVGLVFNVNDNDESFPDDYAPDNYTNENYNYSITITSIRGKSLNTIPENYLISAYPNPFNNQINISFDKPVTDVVSASIFDVNGRKIYEFGKKDLLDGKIIWNGISNTNSEAGSGVYFFELRTKDKIYSRKIILLK